MGLATIGLIGAIFIILLVNTIKILKEYERGVIFFLGRFLPGQGTGIDHPDSIYSDND